MNPGPDRRHPKVPMRVESLPRRRRHDGAARIRARSSGREARGRNVGARCPAGHQAERARVAARSGAAPATGTAAGGGPGDVDWSCRASAGYGKTVPLAEWVRVPACAPAAGEARQSCPGQARRSQPHRGRQPRTRAQPDPLTMSDAARALSAGRGARTTVVRKNGSFNPERAGCYGPSPAGAPRASRARRHLGVTAALLFWAAGRAAFSPG